MKRLPRIVRVTEVAPPYFVSTLWTNGEERQINLGPLIGRYEAQGDERFAPLKDWEVFKQVSVSPEHTLCWKNLLQHFTLPSGKTLSSPLDLDPDVLYEQSQLQGRIAAVPNVGRVLKKARQEAGLSQGDIAAASGTTRGYISRVENGKTDIQLGTLYKLICLGLGRELKLAIE